MLGRILGIGAVIVIGLVALKLLFVLLPALLHGVFALLGIAGTIIWIVALIDIVLRSFSSTTTKVLWFVAVFFTHIFGAIAYFLLGRRAGNVYA